LELICRDSQQNGVGGNDCGVAVRLAVEQRAIAEHVARAGDSLDHLTSRSVLSNLAPAADDEEHGVARRTVTENDRALRIFAERGVGEQAVHRLLGQQRKEWVRRERFGFEGEWRRPGGGWRQGHMTTRRRLSYSTFKPAKHYNS
jgi:hypothetical protein